MVFVFGGRHPNKLVRQLIQGPFNILFGFSSNEQSIINPDFHDLCYLHKSSKENNNHSEHKDFIDFIKRKDVKQHERKSIGAASHSRIKDYL